MQEFNDFLTGKCLISVPSGKDEGLFAKSVIYVCSHSKDGAMGFIINKKMQEVSFQDIVNQMDLGSKIQTTDADLYNGGPLERIRGFVLHSTEYVKSDTVMIDENFAISSSLEVVADIACGMGPKNKIITLGYAGWKKGQLEEEIKQNMWLITDATPDLVFCKEDEQKWQTGLKNIGIDEINFISDIVRA